MSSNKTDDDASEVRVDPKWELAIVIVLDSLIPLKVCIEAIHKIVDKKYIRKAGNMHESNNVLIFLENRELVDRLTSQRITIENKTAEVEPYVTRYEEIHFSMPFVPESLLENTLNQHAIRYTSIRPGKPVINEPGFDHICTLDSITDVRINDIPKLRNGLAIKYNGYDHAVHISCTGRFKVVIFGQNVKTCSANSVTYNQQQNTTSAPTNNRSITHNQILNNPSSAKITHFPVEPRNTYSASTSYAGSQRGGWKMTQSTYRKRDYRHIYNGEIQSAEQVEELVKKINLSRNPLKVLKLHVKRRELNAFLNYIESLERQLMDDRKKFRYQKLISWARQYYYEES